MLLLLGEGLMPHSSTVARKAYHDIVAGSFKNIFWWGAVVLGHIVALILIAYGHRAAAGLAAIAGLYCYEYCFVIAPQKVPNS